MLFNIERDEGNRIVGYLVPDAFSGSPSVRITDGHKDLATLPCQEERAALVAAGRHETGRCGFTIDDKIIPDLFQQERLELYDSETNILIYRRRPPAQVIQKRIFRLETGLVPLWRLDDSLERHFQFFYKGIERHGGETATQLFLLNNSGSLYLSGRLVFKAYENYIDDSFTCVAMLRNPYKELAERLLTLKLIRKFADKFSLLGERDMMAFGPAMEFAETLKSDEKVLRRAFGSMPKAVIPTSGKPLDPSAGGTHFRRNADEGGHRRRAWHVVLLCHCRPQGRSGLIFGTVRRTARDRRGQPASNGRVQQNCRICRPTKTGAGGRALDRAGPPSLWCGQICG